MAKFRAKLIRAPFLGLFMGYLYNGKSCIGDIVTVKGRQRF